MSMRNLIARLDLDEAKSVDTPNLDRYLARPNMMLARVKLRKDSAKDRIEIFDAVENDLSPENITCDGECSAAEVRKAAKFLNNVMKELIALDPSLKGR